MVTPGVDAEEGDETAGGDFVVVAEDGGRELLRTQAVVIEATARMEMSARSRTTSSPQIARSRRAKASATTALRRSSRSTLSSGA